MNKFIHLMLLFSLISGFFLTVFTPVLAAGLVADSWNTKVPMSHARLGLGVVAVDDKIYAIGGYGVDGWVGANECYDPVSDTWVTLMSMPTPRADFAIAACQGKIYCIGGTVPGAVSSVNECYDIATDSWSTKASLSRAMGNMQVCSVVDGQIFVMSGDGSLYVYEPVGDLWVKKTSAPSSMGSSLCSSVLNNKLVVFGTFNYLIQPSMAGQYNVQTDVYSERRILSYDPKTDKWQRLSSAPEGEMTYYEAIGVTTGNYAPESIYIFEDSKINVYNPVNDAWSTAESMAYSRRQFGVAVVDDVFYVIGGSIFNDGKTHALSLNEQYIPIGYSGPLLSNPAPVIIVVALTLIVGILVIVLFYCFRKRGKDNKT